MGVVGRQREVTNIYGVFEMKNGLSSRPSALFIATTKTITKYPYLGARIIGAFEIFHVYILFPSDARRF